MKIFTSYLLVCFLFAFSQIVFATPESFAPIVKSERDKVVHISVVSKRKTPQRINPFFEKFFEHIPKERKERASGSGFIISSDGYIVTNNHVIDGADKIEIIMTNEVKYTAELIGKDPKTDLALLKIEEKNLPFVTMGDSAKLQIGDWLLAIGNPFGLDYSVTAGILSAKERDIFQGTAYGQFLQTDAAINFGNSGGPLFNTKGEVIGINTAISAQGQNIGFAIPSNLAVQIIEQLKNNGLVTRGFLGVGIQEVNPELAQALQLPKGTKGVAITKVHKNTPAAKAGIQEADVFIEFNGKKLNKAVDLQRWTAEAKPGNTAKIKIYRKGKILTKNIVIEVFNEDNFNEDDFLGMQLKEVTPDVVKEYKLRTQTGVLITGVLPDSLAEERVAPGDVIIKINRVAIESINQLLNVIEQSKENQQSAVTVLINRYGRQLLIALPLR